MTTTDWLHDLTEFVENHGGSLSGEQRDDLYRLALADPRVLTLRQPLERLHDAANTTLALLRNGHPPNEADILDEYIDEAGQALFEVPA